MNEVWEKTIFSKPGKQALLLIRNMRRGFVKSIVEQKEDYNTQEIPIPKMRTPRSTDNSKRMTLFSVEYKFYANFPSDN